MQLAPGIMRPGQQLEVKLQRVQGVRIAWKIVYSASFSSKRSEPAGKKVPHAASCPWHDGWRRGRSALFKSATCTKIVERTSTSMSSTPATAHVGRMLELVRSMRWVPLMAESTRTRVVRIRPPRCALQPARHFADGSAAALASTARAGATIRRHASRDLSTRPHRHRRKRRWGSTLDAPSCACWFGLHGAPSNGCKCGSHRAARDKLG